MIYSRKAVCSICGCKVLIACIDSVARVFKRAEVTVCPQCGSELAWSAAPIPTIFSLSVKGRRSAENAS